MKHSRNTTVLLGDYFALAVAPALIMALVVSLVFFLLEVLHAGLHQGRLQWILFFFTFGAVLIARVSMTGEISGRAGIYGVFLGGATWLGLTSFVEYTDSPLAGVSALINVGLIALVWWCAHRLTWDCTYLDDDDGALGHGVLQAAGLEATTTADSPQASTSRPKKTPGGLAGWWQRYDAYRRQAAARRTPGVWVIYFSLAALPLFGLGQSLIPVEHAARRRYAFWLLTIYVGSGLGLLLLTTFLGLRRYLRRRKLEMPKSIAGLWLSLGVGLIAALLAVGAFLPRPAAEYPLFELAQIGSQRKTASKKDVLGGQGADGKGQPGQEEEDPDEGDGKEPKDGAGQPTKDGNKGKGKGQGPKGEPKGNKKGKKQESQKGLPQEPPPTTDYPPWLATILTVLKWVVFGLLALVVAILVLRAVLQFLANFTPWARTFLEFFRSLWARLFGSQEPAAQPSGVQAAPPTSARPFASFRNPFADGSAGQRSLHELIHHTFEALEAWARERDHGRPMNETPFEFTDRLAHDFADLGEHVRRLASLHARAVYAPRGPMPGSARAVLEACWVRMEEEALLHV